MSNDNVTALPVVHNRSVALDGYTNVLTALGAANPRTAANGYVSVEPNPGELDAAYRSSQWFGKIVDIPAEDATREWRQWQASKQQITALGEEEKRLGLQNHVRQALIWARLFGGAAILMGGLKGNPEEPLDINSVGKGGLRFLTVLNKNELTAGELENNPLDPNYNNPKYYNLQTVRIHPSRLVRFIGRARPATIVRDGWGDSVWMTLRDAVTNSDSASSIVASLLQEAKVDVIRMQSMMENLSTGEYEDLLIKRFMQVAAMKSVTNAFVLDKDDEWQQKQITWTGLPDVVRLLLIIMSGAADIPVTRLIGTSATGMNATGEGDLKNYYDKVRAEQTLRISPAMDVLDKVLIRSALGGAPSDIWYNWNLLWQPTAKELSDNNKTNAEADRVYADTGLVPLKALAKSVQNRLIESGIYPGLEDALEEFPENDEDQLGNDDPADNTVPDEDDEPAQATDAAPMSLYVYRKVQNAAEIVRWAKAQGFKDPQPAGEMHVTVMYSRKPVDWMAAGEDWQGGKLTINEGGPRVVSRFDKGATVLEFASSALSWRHLSIKQRTGAESDYDGYKPHITISYEGEPPADVEPYQGKIVLGPEFFEEIR